MAKLVGRLKSLKSLKQLIIDRDQEEDTGGCIQTPTDTCVRHAEARISTDTADAATQGGGNSKGRCPDCIQTPTSMHVADAEADVADSPSGSLRSGNSGGGLVGLLARRFSRVRTFHGSYDEVDGSLPQQQRKAVSFSASHHSQRGGRPGRRRGLQGSASQPELAATLSGAALADGGTPAHSPTIMVLGKEARRRSERRRATFAGDEAPPISPVFPPQPEAGVTAAEASARSSTRVLYSMVAPLRSPFADIPPLSVEGSCPSAAASSSQPDQAPLSSPSPSMRKSLMLRRKISSNKLIVSTEPLEQNPGDIMLAPEVVEFAAEALQSMGGRYTGEIEFSGRSARVARRMSTHRVSGVQGMFSAVAAA